MVEKSNSDGSHDSYKLHVIVTSRVDFLSSLEQDLVRIFFFLGKINLITVNDQSANNFILRYFEILMLFQLEL